MSENLVIVVRQEHIDRGQPMNPWGCAVAECLRDMGHVPWVSTHEVRASSKRYAPSLELRDFIIAFDKRERVYPERFVLQPVRESVFAPAEENSPAA